MSAGIWLASRREEGRIDTISRFYPHGSTALVIYRRPATALFAFT